MTSELENNDESFTAMLKRLSGKSDSKGLINLNHGIKVGDIIRVLRSNTVGKVIKLKDDNVIFRTFDRPDGWCEHSAKADYVEVVQEKLPKKKHIKLLNFLSKNNRKLYTLKDDFNFKDPMGNEVILRKNTEMFIDEMPSFIDSLYTLDHEGYSPSEFRVALGSETCLSVVRCFLPQFEKHLFIPMDKIVPYKWNKALIEKLAFPDKERVLNYLKYDVNLESYGIKNHKGKGKVLLFYGDIGCLSGDTEIQIGRQKIGRKFTLKHLCNVFNNNMFNLPKYKAWDLTVPTYVRSYNGKEIRLHKINNVVYSGKKETYVLTLENGNAVRLTKEHKVMTRDGWIEAKDLKPYIHEVMCDKLKAEKNGRRKVKLPDAYVGVDNHPYMGKLSRLEVHRAIFEANLNGLEFLEYLDILLNEPLKSKALKFIDPSKYHIHHKDGNHYNNAINNLEMLAQQDHLKSHASDAYRNFSQGQPVFSKVVDLKYFGEEDVFDIQCEEPHHNFVANNMVVHNSGKTLTVEALSHFLKKPLIKLDIEELNALFVIRSGFQQATTFDGILFIDEADVVVADRNSPHARAEAIRIFLKYLEQFEGIVIFSTNFGSRIDPALDNRIDMKIHYKLDEHTRKTIWEKSLPLKLEGTFNIDKYKLYDLNGRDIQKIVMFAGQRAALMNLSKIPAKFVEEEAELRKIEKENYRNAKYGAFDDRYLG